MTKTSAARIERFVSEFIRSEFVANWTAENTESGGYSRNEDSRDRYSRCYDAAEDGADGMTHAEHIADWREAFSEWTRQHKTNWRGLDTCRFTDAVDAHFDAIELWHDQNGSLNQEIG